MKHIVLFLILFLSITAAAQKDSLAKYTDAQLIEKGFNTPLTIYAETALKRTKSDSVKVDALFELGTYHLIVKNDYESAITFYERCAKLAKKVGYKRYFYNSLSDMCTSYIIIGKNTKALSILKKMQEYRDDPEYEMCTDEGDIYFLLGDFAKSNLLIKHKIKRLEVELDKENVSAERIEWLNKTCFWMQQNLISNYSYEKKLDSALFYIKASKKYDLYNFTNDGRVWNNEVFIWILKKKPDNALEIMQRYKKRIDSYLYDTFLSLYYKALCYQQKGDYQKGLKFAKEAIKNKTPSYSFQNYELESYRIAADCAGKLGKTAEASIYSKKYIDLSQKVNYAQKAAFMAKLYEQNDIDPLKKQLVTKTDISKILFWGLSILCILALYLGYKNVKSKREKKKFLAIIKSLEDKNNHKAEYKILQDPVVLEDVIEKGNIAKRNISPDTEDKILSKLKEFEKNQRFLDSNISLGTLALEFETNTSYITYVIKKHKNDNLTNYVNKLRIDYIIQKMTSDPNYSKYKIEYLAQECGFSSYISFKRVFNKEIGMDPSKFIGYLKNGNLAK